MRGSACVTDTLSGASCVADGNVADDDVATLGAEPNGRGCADTSRTTGHDRNSASQSLQGHSRSFSDSRDRRPAEAVLSTAVRSYGSRSPHHMGVLTMRVHVEHVAVGRRLTTIPVG